MIRTTVKLDSLIFRDTPRRQAVSNLVRRQARDLKDLTKRRMIESRPTGRMYRKRRGPGFRRFHRASAWGERPAIDTGTLLNSIIDERTGEFSARTEATADYAKYLQSERLNRPIMDERDAAEAQRKLDREAAVALSHLT